MVVAAPVVVVSGASVVVVVAAGVVVVSGASVGVVVLGGSTVGFPIGVSQVGPVNPCIQMHMNPPTMFSQIPFLQG